MSSDWRAPQLRTDLRQVLTHCTPAKRLVRQRALPNSVERQRTTVQQCSDGDRRCPPKEPAPAAQRAGRFASRRGVKIAPKWTAYARDRPNEFSATRAYNLENIVVALASKRGNACWSGCDMWFRASARRSRRCDICRTSAASPRSWTHGVREYFDFPMGLRNVQDQKGGPYLEFINEACRIFDVRAPSGATFAQVRANENRRRNGG